MLCRMTTATAEIQVDQEVRVFDSPYWAERSGMPPGGWVGRIIKITPKQVHIRYGEIGRVDVFAREGQRIASGDIWRKFRTLPQVEEDERWHAALHVLRQREIKLDPRSFTIEQVEALAEVVKTFGKEGGER
jgi:hypothetical protein